MDTDQITGGEISLPTRLFLAGHDNVVRTLTGPLDPNHLSGRTPAPFMTITRPTLGERGGVGLDFFAGEGPPGATPGTKISNPFGIELGNHGALTVTLKSSGKLVILYAPNAWLEVELENERLDGDAP